MPSSTGPHSPLLIDLRGCEVASLTDVGRVRSQNQDSCAQHERPDGTRLLIVADGMGGHRGGETASRLAVEAMSAAFEGAAADVTFSGEWLRDAIQSANAAVHAASKADNLLRGMGTTVVAILIDTSGRGFVSHVGDSRAYRIRGEAIVRLTGDHSVVGEMQRRGMLTEEEAARHPRRNEILRSVGVDANVDPEVAEVNLDPSDSLMLCSDGLCGLLNDDEIYDAMQETIDAGAPEGGTRGEVGRIVDEWIARANSAGGPDNITAVLLRIPSQPLAAIAPAEASGSYAAIGMLSVLVAGVIAFAWILWH